MFGVLGMILLDELTQAGKTIGSFLEHRAPELNPDIFFWPCTYG